MSHSVPSSDPAPARRAMLVSCLLVLLPAAFAAECLHVQRDGLFQGFPPTHKPGKPVRQKTSQKATWSEVVGADAAADAAELRAHKETFDALLKRVAKLEGSTPAQWRVIWKTDPATTATVSWSTAAAGKTHALYWDTRTREGKLEDYAHKTVCQRNGDYTLRAKPPAKPKEAPKPKDAKPEPAKTKDSPKETPKPKDKADPGSPLTAKPKDAMKDSAVKDAVKDSAKETMKDVALAPALAAPKPAAPPSPLNSRSVAQASYHHARLTRLQPATTYYFVMVSDGVASPEMRFTTAPNDDRPVTLLAGGDSRTGEVARCMINWTMARLMAEDQRVLALCHGGDFVGSGDSWYDWNQWLSQHELTTAEDGQCLPIIPTRGNHDPGDLYDEIFDFPAKSENYFRCDINASSSIFVLNSEVVTSGRQRDWLEEELKRERPRRRWLVPEYHRPAYPAVKEASRAKASWVPLFERYNVDLVMEWDGHVIKRTVPIRNDRYAPGDPARGIERGVVYIGEGGLGVGQRAPDLKRWFLQPPGYAGRGHHVVVLDFSADALRIRFHRLNGETADEATLLPRGYGESAR